MKCLICNKIIQNKRKYCSRECYFKGRIGKPTWNNGLTKEIHSSLKRISKKMTGRKNRPCSPETKEKIRQTKLGDKNPNWKGDKVQYAGLHLWVGSNFPKPKICPMCKMKPPYDLCNKGIYNRDFKNWEWLCRKCHMIKDGRLKKIKELNKKKE